MRSALYYPHTKLESQSLLKTSLLMWDHLEFIVPYPEYNTSYRNKDIERAIELFGVQRCPSKTDKSKAHDIIEDFATRPLPTPFFTGQITRTDIMKFTRRNLWVKLGKFFKI
jgi:hypothetical protein